jgi:hypothetical protein
VTGVDRALDLMNTTLIVVIIIAVVVLVAIGVAAYMLNARRRSERLREHFGPEYERSLAETEDPKETERALAEREKRHRSLSLRHLDDGERTRFRDRWLTVQSAFVDDPDRAVERADDLVSEVMSARGYPVADFDRRAEDVSVDHPIVVQHYREARAISQRNSEGRVDTEELRRAVTSYRALVEALLDESDDHASDHDDRRTGGADRDGKHRNQTEETTA